MECLEGDRRGFGPKAGARVEGVEPAISSGMSSKSKTSKFSAMRAGLTDFGIAERPCCRCQRSITWAADLPCRPAIADRRVVEVLLPPPGRR